MREVVVMVVAVSAQCSVVPLSLPLGPYLRPLSAPYVRPLSTCKGVRTSPGPYLIAIRSLSEAPI